MSDFIVKVPPPQEAIGPTITSDGWPTLNVQSCRDRHRLDGTVTTPRISAALTTAMLHVQDQLTPWLNVARLISNDPTRTFVEQSEIAQTSEINGEPNHTHRYRTAVYAYTAAIINEQMRGFDTTSDGKYQHERDEITGVVNELRREGFFAIRDIIGEPRCVIGLL